MASRRSWVRIPSAPPTLFHKGLRKKFVTRYPILSLRTRYWLIGAANATHQGHSLSPGRNGLYIAVFNDRRKFVEVSPSFCKLLGYAENEIIGRPFEDFTVPRTNNIPVLLHMLIQNGYLQGIWVFAHRSGTKLFVRYATVLRTDGLYEASIELIAAGPDSPQKRGWKTRLPRC